MQFAYTIIYVPDVAASLDFFERAFGFNRKFLHESGTYGELETGATTLAFAAHELADMNYSGGHIAAHTSPSRSAWRSPSPRTTWRQHMPEPWLPVRLNYPHR